MVSTSKEALEILRECANGEKKVLFSTSIELANTIKQDLDKLEKLEQIIEIVKSIGLTFQKDLEYYECDYGDWFKAPYAIEGSPVSEAEWKLVKEEFEGEE